MRIAIVDDISEERTLLRNRLESQFSRRNVHTDILEYENGETFLTAAIQQKNFADQTLTVCWSSQQLPLTMH